MGFRYAIIIITLCAFAASSQIASAQNVLLPSDNGNGGNLPNLGLMPAPTPAPPIETPAPPKTATPAPVPAPTPVPPPTLPSLPPEQARPVVPQAAAHIMNVVVSDALTPNDIANINTQLGIAPNSVIHECQIGINGMLLSDSGSAPIESNQKPTTNVAYDGKLTNVILSLYATCPSAPKPASDDYLQKVGNSYLVSLSGTTCTPPASYTGVKQKLTIHHADGGDTCTFQ